jgi:lipid II isoglutaminyl synthase (glutamine-hydrolysing)
MEGIGLLDVTSVCGERRRGSVVGRPISALGLPAMSGWVDHQQSLVRGDAVKPFLRLEVGVGDQGEEDGILSGRIIGTRLHGPVLARNPELADVVIAWAQGMAPAELAPLPAGMAERARSQRIEEDRLANRRDRPGLLRRTS